METQKNPKPTEKSPSYLKSICLEMLLCPRLSLCAGSAFLCLFFVSPFVSISQGLPTVLPFAILALSRCALSWQGGRREGHQNLLQGHLLALQPKKQIQILSSLQVRGGKLLSYLLSSSEESPGTNEVLQPAKVLNVF